MIQGKKLVVVLPGFNAEKTLAQTYAEIPHAVVDELILVDDCSNDGTVALANKLGIRVVQHQRNGGYGANQKTCFQLALAAGADVVVMLHPDYQYSPKLVTALAEMNVSGHYDAVLASRILGGGALKGGMPLYKYVANRVLTLFQNLLLGQKLSEYHTGYRSYSATALKAINFMANSDGFVFDNQIITQLFQKGFSIGEISCPTKYFPEASSINFVSSTAYGWGVVRTTCEYLLHKWNVIEQRRYM